MAFGNQGPSQAEVAATEKERRADIGWLQSAITDTNIGYASDTLRNNLLRFDEISRQTQGTSALALARSGAMTSRAKSSFATKAELGIDFDSANPLAAITETRDALQAKLDAYSAFDTDIAAKKAAQDALWDTRDITEERETAESKARRGVDEDSRAERQSERDAATADYQQQIDSLRLQRRNQRETIRQMREDGASPDEIEAAQNQIDDINDAITAARDGLNSALAGLAEEDEEEYGDIEPEYETVVVGTEEYITDQALFDTLQAEIEQLQTDKATFEEDLAEDGGLETIEGNVEYLDTLKVKLDGFVEEVRAEAGDGAVDIQQLGFTSGSTLSSVSRGLEMLRMERDKVFNQGVTGVSQFFQAQMNAEEQAEFDRETADEYLALANRQQQQQQIQDLFSMAGFVAGVAGMPFTGGASLKLGTQTGSFLGNIFSRTVT